MTAAFAPAKGDQVRVVSLLNGGRYNRRTATVIHRYESARGERLVVQLDEWTSLDAPNGKLYLDAAEVIPC